MAGPAPKGFIKLQLADKTYHPGETISGSVELRLKEPVDLENLTIRFKGDTYTEKVNLNETNSNGRAVKRFDSKSGIENVREPLFDFSTTVVKDLHLSAGSYTYPFSILIPEKDYRHQPLLGDPSQEGLMANLVTISKLSTLEHTTYFRLDAQASFAKRKDLSLEDPVSVTIKPLKGKGKDVKTPYQDVAKKLLKNRKKINREIGLVVDVFNKLKK